MSIAARSPDPVLAATSLALIVEVAKLTGWTSRGWRIYDWYVEYVLSPTESARAPVLTRPPKERQLLLPGIDVHYQNAGSYFADSF
jgi:hypothetical protein